MAPVVNKKRSVKSQGKSEEKTVKKPRISVDSSDEDNLDNLSAEEDDLDNLSAEEGDEDVEIEDADENSESASAAKADGSSNHGEQRKLLKERKLKRSSGSEIQNIKHIWEKLRCKTPPLPKQIRDKLSNEIWDIAKDKIADLVLKHDASRIVQTLVKYSTKDRRDQIVLALKGKYYVLATSSYGKYLLVKLLHYGSKSSRQLIINELHGNLRKLMRHREGAYVVEDLFVLYATNDQKQQMIREFWGSEYGFFRDEHSGLTLEDVCSKSVEKRNIIARNLIGTITASVEKGSTGFQILHAAMREMVKIANTKEIDEMIELLHEQFAELVHTPEGADVACTLMAKANAKQRKLILKSLKAHGEKLIKNEHGNLVFTTLLLTVDDTVLIYKTFGDMVKENLVDFILDKYGRRPFLYMLLGLDGKYFNPLVKKELNRYIEMSKETSKKDPLVRRQQLLSKFGPLMVSVINKDYSILLEENIGAQFISEVLTNDDLFEQLDDKQKIQFEDLINSIAVVFKGDISEEEHPIHTPFSTRLLKSLIQGGKWNNKERKVEPLRSVEGLGIPFASKFYDEIVDFSNVLAWINNKDSSFIIVALYDSLNKAEEGEQFVKDLKAIKKQIDVSEESNNKGAQLLVKLLK
ncbi:pumilio homology domain family member 6 [Monosporozyma servazzii]